MITMDQARERAAAGAAYFDALQPGWFEDVNLDILDMSQADACVSGQVFGVEIYRWLDRHPADVAFGLVLAEGENDHDARDEGYGPLTEAWREQIEQRIQA